MTQELTMQKARWSLAPSDQRSPSLQKCQSSSLAEVTSILDNRTIGKVLCPHSLVPSENVIFKTDPSFAVLIERLFSSLYF